MPVSSVFANHRGVVALASGTLLVASMAVSAQGRHTCLRLALRDISSGPVDRRAVRGGQRQWGRW